MPDVFRFEDYLLDEEACTTYEMLEEKGLRGIESLFFEMDDLLNGLQPGELTIIAARPSMGKTSLLLNIMEHAAIDSRLKCALFSLEASRRQIIQRLLSSRSQIDGHKLRKGLMSADEFMLAAKSIGELMKAPLAICAPAILHIDDLCDAIILAAADGARIIAVDYIQLLNSKGNNRTEELTYISRKLKTTARRISASLIATSQLNRWSVQDPARRPRLDDLPGSGTLEDDADTILLIHRQDYCHIQEPDFMPDNIAEVIIAKQRNGPTGTIKLTFDNKTTSFKNLAAQIDSF